MRNGLRLLVVLAVTVTVGSSVSCGNGSTEPTATVVIVRDNTFSPQAVTVPVGTRVRWVNSGAAVHDVTQYDGEFDSGALDPGRNFEVELESAGTFNYACTRHAGMQGAVIVE